MTLYKKIADELLTMVKIDQKMRLMAIKDNKFWDKNVDRHNTERLKDIISEVGLPTISKVGLEASKAAWLIAQHADHDLKFQKDVLKKIKKAVKDKDFEAKYLAYITDRVTLKENGWQIYGTQFKRNKNNSWQPLPLKDDWQTTNKKRLEIGLNTLEEYSTNFNN